MLDPLGLQDKPISMEELGKLVYVFKTVKTVIPLDGFPDASSNIVTNNVGRGKFVES